MESYRTREGRLHHYGSVLPEDGQSQDDEGDSCSDCVQFNPVVALYSTFVGVGVVGQLARYLALGISHAKYSAMSLEEILQEYNLSNVTAITTEQVQALMAAQDVYQRMMWQAFDVTQALKIAVTIASPLILMGAYKLSQRVINCVEISKSSGLKTVLQYGANFALLAVTFYYVTEWIDAFRTINASDDLAADDVEEQRNAFLANIDELLEFIVDALSLKVSLNSSFFGAIVGGGFGAGVYTAYRGLRSCCGWAKGLFGGRSQYDPLEEDEIIAADQVGEGSARLKNIETSFR